VPPPPSAKGVKLVKDAGEGLNAIEDLVLSANAHMEAIATAAQEQSVGVTEVNSAVNHMDQSTQQNAAMVEQMNAAGTGLAQDCLRLEGLLTHFRFEQEASMLRETAKRQTGSASAPCKTSARRPLPVDPDRISCLTDCGAIRHEGCGSPSTEMCQLFPEVPSV
jgi:methyl-accepting chemotaxis protein